MSQDISALRAHLFAALAGLSDKENPMDIERAKAIADVGQVIINTAKVEVEHIKAVGGKGSGFIPSLAAPPQNPPARGQSPFSLAVGNVVGHGHGDDE
jgi:hypothetical protein